MKLGLGKITLFLASVFTVSGKCSQVRSDKSSSCSLWLEERSPVLVMDGGGGQGGKGCSQLALPSTFPSIRGSLRNISESRFSHL